MQQRHSMEREPAGSGVGGTARGCWSATRRAAFRSRSLRYWSTWTPRRCCLRIHSARSSSTSRWSRGWRPPLFREAGGTTSPARASGPWRRLGRERPVGGAPGFERHGPGRIELPSQSRPRRLQPDPAQTAGAVPVGPPNRWAERAGSLGAFRTTAVRLGFSPPLTDCPHGRCRRPDRPVRRAGAH